MKRAFLAKEARGPIAWMARNRVAANLVMLILMVGGAFSVLRIKQEFLPDFELDIVHISVAYPGASPAEVEQGIILAIEESVRGVDGVKRVTSGANEGVGTVAAELLLGADDQKVFQDIKNEVDRIVTFPEEAERPQVSLLTMKRKVISLVLYGNVQETVLREMAEQIRQRLLGDERITQVELSAVKPYEISVEVPHENLRAYNLTLDEVARKVAQAAVEIPGGGIKTESGEVLLRMMERRDFGRQFRDIGVVTRPDGTDVRLGEIAEVVDGFADIDTFASYDGKPAIVLNVYRVGEQTPIEVADAVKEQVAQMARTLPPGLSVTTYDDMSKVYRQRVELLLRNASYGLVLVLLLLGVFLEARLAFWVTLGIPISFLGALLFLPAVNVSINMVSLFAFIIALGIVVDDAIVVGENVYRWRQQGLKPVAAAIRGAREVALPVVFSILTNVAAFAPLYFVPGVYGKFFRMIPAVVVLVFLVSLAESLFVLPAHLGHQQEKRRRGVGAWVHYYQQRFSDGVLWFINRVYGPVLGGLLRVRYLTVAAGLAVLILCAAYARSGRLGREQFSRVEADFTIGTAELPVGVPVQDTQRVKQHLVDAARAVIARAGVEDEVLGIFAEIGADSMSRQRGPAAPVGGNRTNVKVLFVDPEARTMSPSRFANLWRQEVGEIPGVETTNFSAEFGGPSSGPALTVELRHTSLDVLDQASAALAARLREVEHVIDIDDGFQPGKVQLDFQVRPEAEALGLTAADVARQIRGAFYGSEALRQQRGRNEIKVMVRLPQDERLSEYALEELLIRTPGGGEIPLDQAVQIDRGRAYTTISRADGKRIVNVTADINPRSKLGEVQATLKQDVLPALRAEFPGLAYSFEGSEREFRESMQGLTKGFMLAMLVIYALLAIPFRSYVQPLIIMVSIPFGIIGAVLGHILMDYSLSVISMMGIVALAGVVVNDSLVLIEFANRMVWDGIPPAQAIRAAGLRRFRPILLTSLTTFGGLAPMIFETSMQARFLIPMAISLGFGILFSTVITLILVPSLFLILEDIRSLFHRERVLDQDAELGLEPSPAQGVGGAGS